MIRLGLYVIFLIFPLWDLQAQGGIETLPRGARSVGQGNANVTISDSWSLFNNIGALGMIAGSSIAVGYDHRFNLNELTTLSATAVIHTDGFQYGLSVSSFGEEHFNQSNIGFGIANQLGIASLGLKINYFQTNIEGFGRAAAPVLEFGGVAELSPNLFFGAHIYNIANAKVGGNSEDRIPTVVKSGISYRPTEKLMVNIEAEKDILLDAVIKLGIEYNLMDRIWLRSGVNTYPSNLFFGVGFRPKNFVIDYAMIQSPYLGNTHHFSFGYLFQK